MNYNINPLYLINGIASGSGPSFRIGRKIICVSVQCRISVRNVQQSTTTDPFNSYSRFFIIYDKQTNGALAAGADVFSTVFTSPPVPIHPTAAMNLNNRDRFRVIMDEVVLLGYSLPIASITFYKKIRCETIFQSDNGNIADISTGALLFGFWDQNGVAAANPNMTASIRTRYVDN